SGSLALNISANWDYVELSGPATDRVSKTSGSSTVGHLTRVDNKNVTVAYASTVAYSITIKWNGSSTGSTYLIGAT
ncbi:MAG TPA: hypothetical protein VNS19_20270, partial [Acidimicrobiales bacterium]|nr:hypothetical protein [Acidimicrobiales bacterium]